MILVGKETKQSPAQVLDRAVKYFGPDNLGLEIVHWDAATVELQGGGGYVAVRAQQQQEMGLTSVEVEGREWEYDVERFLEEL